MTDENEIADHLIPGGLKKSKSYHSDLGKLTYGEIKRRIKAEPLGPEKKRLRQMKKLIEERARLLQKRGGR